MLAGYDREHNLKHVFAGMVGKTYGGVKIKPNTWYELGGDGELKECAE